MSGLKQNNAQEIVTPITLNGEAIEVSKLASATYKLLSFDKSTALVEKSMGSGITADDGNTLTIAISAEDCKTLSGTYYHELTIVDPVEGRLTAFDQFVTFEPTYNHKF